MAQMCLIIVENGVQMMTGATINPVLTGLKHPAKDTTMAQA